MSTEDVDPWIDCELCGRRSPPDFDTYEDVIIHNCEADEWIGVELESGSVRGPYPSHDGPWPTDEEACAGDRVSREIRELKARDEEPDPSKFFRRPPTRELSEEEIARFQGFVGMRFDEAVAAYEERMAANAQDSDD